MDPLLELFSSKGGTFQFQGGNFLVPREELSSSKGGIEKSLGRDDLLPHWGGNFQTEETISFPRMKLWTFLEM